MLTLFWTVGFFVNLLLLMQLVLRPKLWSTTNTYTGFLLCLNSSYMLLNLIVNDSGIAFNNDDILSLLELLYADQYRSAICTVKYFGTFFHSAISLYLIVTIIFIRSMMVKRAPDICEEKYQCKKHQAHLGSIGFLVAIVGVTAIVGKICFFMIDPQTSYEYILVLPCRGLVKDHSDDEKKKIIRIWFIRVMVEILMVLHTIACHVRVLRFQRAHNRSYFRKVRQNINTFQEMLAASYLITSGALVEEVAFITLVYDQSPIIRPSIVYDAVDILYCIILPSYWLFSTKRNFAEFWSMENLFWRKPRKRPKLTWCTGPFEPRRPFFKLENSGRFSYALNLKKTHLKQSATDLNVSPSFLHLWPSTPSPYELQLQDLSMSTSKSLLKAKFPQPNFLSLCSTSGYSPPSSTSIVDIQPPFSYPSTPSPLFARTSYMSFYICHSGESLESHPNDSPSTISYPR